MTDKPVHPWVKAALEFGPVVGFVATYLVYRNDTFMVAGTEYSGFVAVTALFIPVFLLAIAGLWVLSGRVSRMQVFTAVMIALFGGLGVWMNDPALLKMKPTAVYLLLALILGVGLLRGQSWLKYVMEDMVPMKPAGWMLLTRRVMAMFLVAAAANELVWRTQSETVWVIFETFVMPVAIAGFIMSQMSLFVDNITTGTPKKRSQERPPQDRSKRHGSRKASRDL